MNLDSLCNKLLSVLAIVLNLMVLYCFYTFITIEYRQNNNLCKEGQAKYGCVNTITLEQDFKKRGFNER